VALSLAPRHLARYRDLIRLLRRHAGSDWVRSAGLGEELEEDDEGPGPELRAEADDLARDLEALGPTYIKLGQLLSTRADLLPEPHLKALSRLQDDVEPFPYEQVEEILARELGVRPQAAFASLDPEPLASASLGQVHRATLRDGRPVAVKVQRPGIRRQILDDLEVLSGLVDLLDEHTEAGRTFGFADMFEQFRRSLLAELDYRAEASNLITMADQLAEFERIVVPRPIEDFSTGKVLTMEYVAGRKVTDIGPLGRMELDGTGLATELFEAYLEQILGAGFLHADPHPGNVLVTDDGRLALIDLGMVSHLGARMQERLVKLLLAVGEGRGEEVARQAVEMGTQLTGFDGRRLERDTVDLVARHHGARLGQIGAGSILAELLAICGQCRLRPPVELTMMGKALLNLDEVARTLDPDFDPQAAIRNRAGELVQRRAWTTQGGLMRAALETREFVEQLPGRANRLLDRLDEGQLTLKVDAIDEKELLRGVEKLANRVTMGLILAAIIIGAAMTMRVETDSTLFGYPSISIVFFVIAVLGGFALVVATLVGDRRRRRRQDGP
jgi:predicted unusual protein kinase regulating ubiquinone biosynthesis (AarF/ABC1/UbiB family)